MPSSHIHITGASGAGVSTAGRSLASVLGLAFFDTDDFFWVPSDPPYREIRPMPGRLTLLTDTLDLHDGWVLSGSLDGWGDSLASRFDLVVFLFVPTAIRLERLRHRERQRFGAALDPGGAMHAEHQAFLAWSAAYDSGDHDGGRTLQRHRDWLARLPCPVLRIEGETPPEAIIDRIVACLSNAKDST